MLDFSHHKKRLFLLKTYHFYSKFNRFFWVSCISNGLTFKMFDQKIKEIVNFLYNYIITIFVYTLNLFTYQLRHFISQKLL